MPCDASSVWFPDLLEEIVALRQNGKRGRREKVIAAALLELQARWFATPDRLEYALRFALDRRSHVFDGGRWPRYVEAIMRNLAASDVAGSSSCRSSGVTETTFWSAN